MSKPKQYERVLQYIIENGSITSLEAFQHIGATRLSGIIYHLKSKGYEFETSTIGSKNRWGDTVHFAKYEFAK